MNLNEWEHAVLMDTFYSAGGRETVSHKSTDDVGSENLYLYSICYEKEARVSVRLRNVLEIEMMS